MNEELCNRILNLEADLAAAERYIKNRDIRITKLDDGLLAARKEVEALKAERDKLRELLETADIYINPDYEDQFKLKEKIRAVLDKGSEMGELDVNIGDYESGIPI